MLSIFIYRGSAECFVIYLWMIYFYLPNRIIVIGGTLDFKDGTLNFKDRWRRQGDTQQVQTMYV